MNRQALRIPAHNDMLVPNPTRPLERERIIWSLGQWRKRREEKRRGDVRSIWGGVNNSIYYY
jgi:hypothetical protein